jgi:hypothetical protein
MEMARHWLRSLGVLVKRLLGERYCQDETLFLGGVGASSSSIRRYLLAMSVDVDAEPMAAALSLLQAVERQVLNKAMSLTQDDARSLLSTAETITAAMLR